MESHKRCFLWIDEWFDLKEEDIKRLEAENDAVLNKVNFQKVFSSWCYFFASFVKENYYCASNLNGCECKNDIFNTLQVNLGSF